MKLAISAGGTGGHIFPGVAVAEAFTAQDAKNEVVFIGTTEGLEGKIIPRGRFQTPLCGSAPVSGKIAAL